MIQPMGSNNKGGKIGRQSGLRGAVVIQFGSKYINVALTLVVTMVLARLLTPEEYGVMAVVSVFLGLFSVISNVGIGAAVVQYRDLTDEDCGALLTFTAIFGVVLALVFCGLSLPVAALYGSDEYVPLMCLASLSVVFGAANMVPNGILLRDRMFLVSGVRLIVTSLASSLIAIALAFMGWGSYALVLNTVFQSLFVLVWNLVAADLPLGKIGMRGPLRKIMRFSSFQFLSQVLQYFIRNLDNMLIGAVLGSTALGFYDKAYKLAKYPIEIVPGTVGPVLKSFFSVADGDTERIYDLFIKVQKVMSVVGVLASVMFSLCAPELIWLFFGDQWSESVVPFAILSVSIVFQMMNYTVFSVLEGLKRTDYLFRHTLITSISMALLLFAGLLTGSLAAVAAAVSAYFILSTVPFVYFVVCKGFGKSVLGYLHGFVPEFFAGLVTAAAVVGVAQFFPETGIVSFLAKGFVGCALYLLLIWRMGQLKYLKMLVKR